MIKKMMLGAAVALGLSTSAMAETGIKVGTLTCDFDGTVGAIVGSYTNGACFYEGLNGDRANFYAGRLKVGADIGFTNGTTVVWAVITVGDSKPDAMRGYYAGVGADASVGIGLGVNALVGGFNKSIMLQPVSAQGQSGLNAAVAVQVLELD
jgi:hypothetical protein